MLQQIVDLSESVDTDVIVMTSTFDVLSEVPIETNEFGEGMFGFQSYKAFNDGVMIQMLQSMSVGVQKKPNSTDR